MTLLTCPVRVPDGSTVQVCVAEADNDPIAVAVRNGEYPLAGSWPLYARFLRPGATVIDLGVHLGSFALPAAAAGCRVLAVEASPANVTLIRAGIAANRLATLDLVHAAVSDRPGELRFRYDGPYGHIATDQAADGPGIARVPAVTLDAVLADRNVGRVDFVKMDIEGAEVAAVRGMTGLLTGPDAPPVYYESNGHTLALFGHTTRTLRAEFARHGYTNYLIDPDNRRLVPATVDESQPECCIDYLALPAGPDGRPRLPAALSDWEILPAPTAADHLARFRAACRPGEIAPHVAHIAREFVAASDDIRSDPFIAEYVAANRSRAA